MGYTRRGRFVVLSLAGLLLSGAAGVATAQNGINISTGSALATAQLEGLRANSAEIVPAHGPFGDDQTPSVMVRLGDATIANACVLLSTIDVPIIGEVTMVGHLAGEGGMKAQNLVIDAKAPMSHWLQAQADDIDPGERDRLLEGHAAALRAHVDTLAGKAYWTAFDPSPEMVVCFVPSDATLAAALARVPGLHEEAMAARVVLVSPSTLLALLRTVAFAWQQDTVTSEARELLSVGRELYARLATLGEHATRMGRSLQRSVDDYNRLVGSLESRVLVSARRMHELGLATDGLAEVEPVSAAPRPLTAPELLDAVAGPDARAELRHRPGQLDARNRRQRRHPGIGPAPDQQLRPAHADGVGLDQHLARLRPRRRGIHIFQHRRGAGAAQHDGFHGKTPYLTHGPGSPLPRGRTVDRVANSLPVRPRGSGDPVLRPGGNPEF